MVCEKCKLLFRHLCSDFSLVPCIVMNCFVRVLLNWGFLRMCISRVCAGEKKLAKVIVPDKWKEGASNTTEGGGRKINENKLLSKKHRFLFFTHFLWLLFASIYKYAFIHMSICIWTEITCLFLWSFSFFELLVYGLVLMIGQFVCYWMLMHFYEVSCKQCVLPWRIHL